MVGLCVAVPTMADAQSRLTFGCRTGRGGSEYGDDVIKRMASEPERIPKQMSKNLATRARIIGCALSLFSNSGYDEITMESVARTAEVTRANVYLHFKNKSDPVAAIIDALRSDVCDLFRALDQLEPDDLAGISNWVEETLRLWAECPKLYETLELSARCSLNERRRTLAAWAHRLMFRTHVIPASGSSNSNVQWQCSKYSTASIRR